MKKYKLIGLTGTTGAGKSQVAEIFRQNGYTIIDADFMARKAVENPLVLDLLCHHFGDDILEENILNRKLLAKRAFETKEKTALLNSITHPFITAIFIKKIDDLSKKNITKILLDAPQLFESRLDAICDKVVSVVADENIRIKRIMQRDNIDVDAATKRMSVQFSADFFINNSDYIITNNSTLDKLQNQAEKILELL